MLDAIRVNTCFSYLNLDEDFFRTSLMVSFLTMSWVKNVIFPSCRFSILTYAYSTGPGQHIQLPHGTIRTNYANANTRASILTAASMVSIVQHYHTMKIPRQYWMDRYTIISIQSWKNHLYSGKIQLWVHTMPFDNCTIPRVYYI